jgi:hypothetical protein
MSVIAIRETHISPLLSPMSTTAASFERGSTLVGSVMTLYPQPCPGLYLAISELSVLDSWILCAGLCSPIFNFRFGVPETGSICDRDRFAEPHIGGAG